MRGSLRVEARSGCRCRCWLRPVACAHVMVLLLLLLLVCSSCASFVSEPGLIVEGTAGEATAVGCFCELV